MDQHYTEEQIQSVFESAYDHTDQGKKDLILQLKHMLFHFNKDMVKETIHRLELVGIKEATVLREALQKMGAWPK